MCHGSHRFPQHFLCCISFCIQKYRLFPDILHKDEEDWQRKTRKWTVAALKLFRPVFEFTYILFNHLTNCHNEANEVFNRKITISCLFANTFLDFLYSNQCVTSRCNCKSLAFHVWFFSLVVQKNLIQRKDTACMYTQRILFPRGRCCIVQGQTFYTFMPASAWGPFMYSYCSTLRIRFRPLLAPRKNKTKSSFMCGSIEQKLSCTCLKCLFTQF